MIPLSVLDLILVIGFMCLCVAIGFYFRSQGGSSSEDYFLAGRGLASIPAALSIAVSYLSSASLTIYLGEIVTFGIPMYLAIVTCLIVAPIVTHGIQPRFYDSPHLSVYHFLEERFSRSIRQINSLLFLVASALNLAVIGYTAAIAGEVLVQVPFWLAALVVGLFSTLYSTMGGLKAVIWTDVAQAVVIFASYLVIITKLCLSFESFGEMWNLVATGERITFSFKEGPTHRYSVQNILSGTIISFFYMIGISQPGVQRWKSVGSLAQARRTALVTLAILSFSILLTFVTGLCIYAYYAKCSMDSTPLPSPDKLSLHFVSTKLSSWPGTVGLFLGGLLSGALSTYSSYINSMAAVTLEDFVKVSFKSLPARHEILISKALTAFYGLLSTGLIFMAAKTTTVIMIEVVCQSIAISPVVGIFCLALWSKRSNTLGVIVGVSFSAALQVWFFTVTLFRRSKHEPLSPIGTHCARNDSSNEPLFQNVTSSLHVTTSSSSFLESVYDISFAWISPISFVITVVIGFITSVGYTALCKRNADVRSSDSDTDQRGFPLNETDCAENLLAQRTENGNKIVA